MVTLRMFGIAAAILLGTPLLVAATHSIDHLIVEGGEVVDTYAEAGATITDIVLADLPQRYDRVMVAGAPEQLVEGHTVFVSIDVPLVVNRSNASIDITGFVECDHRFNASGPKVLGVPVFNRIHEARVECRVGERVFVTPDPFYDSDETTAAASSVRSPLVPTGRVQTFTTPAGDMSYSEEFTFTTITHDPMTGEPRAKTYYAWAVPIFQPWMHDDGRPKSWVCPIPEDRLREMGVREFSVVFEEDVRPMIAYA